MEPDAYRQFADFEEEHWWFRARRRIFFHLLDRILPRDRTLEVLDVGCGAGGLLRRLERYGNARGLEPYREISVIARERTGLPLICASAYEIPLCDDSQDLVCLFDTLEHIPDESRALQEIHRIVKPGGIAFFSVPAYQFLWSNNDQVAHHCRRYTRARLRRSLLSAGFAPTRLSYFNTLLFPAILPAILLQKLKERTIGVSDPNETNLTVPVPGALAELLFRIMASERFLLSHMNFPVGHSLIAIVRKPAASASGPTPVSTGSKG
jgi:SAM-dependent methyltransferase